MQLCHGNCLRPAELSEPVENDCTDMQLIDLVLEGSGHDPIAQLFKAIHLCLHQTMPVVAIPHFPDSPAQTSASGIFSWTNVGDGNPLNHGLINRVGVSPIKLSVASLRGLAPVDPLRQRAL